MLAGRWCLIGLLLLLGSTPSHANDKLEASYAWVRPTIGDSKTTALYLNLNNYGDSGDALVGVSTPVAANCQVHQSIAENGIVRMMKLPELPLPPVTVVVLEPKSTHIMVMGLTKPLRLGDLIPVTLRFRVARDVTINAVVSMQRPPGPALIE